MAPRKIPAKVIERARAIKLLLLDCDGVLTDGRLYYGPEGEALKVFHVRDGQGLVNWHARGFRSGIISGRNSPIVKVRARELGIEFVLQGRKEKISAVRDLVAISGVSVEEVAFVGDDSPDAEVFPIVGLGAAVADAHASARDAAHFVTKLNGGGGAVREVIDMILDAKKG